MPKRYTYGEVKEIFKENSYELLSKKYINNRTKLVCRDKDGYLFFITLNTVKNKDKSNFIDMSNPYSMRNIRKYIKIHSLKVELLTKEYVNNQYKMEWKCACGNIFYKDWAHFSGQNATRCNDCAQKIRTEKDIMNIEDVKVCFIKKGLIPLFDNYYKNDGYLKCMTKDGYLLNTTLNNVNVCKNSPDIFHTSNPYSIHNIKLYLINNEISTRLVSTIYLGNDKKLIWECGKCGEEFERDLAHFKDRPSYYCMQCSRDGAFEKQRLDFQHVVDIVINHNYKPLFTEYINFKQKLDVEDDLGYKYTPMLATFNNNNNPCKFEKSNKYSFYNLKHYIKLNNIDVELLFDGFLNNSTLLPFKCSCGDVYYATVASFIHNNQHRCSACSKSKSYLALMTEKWMGANDIKYVNEYWYEDCKAIYPLRFDYYLPDYDILIEVDGKHHFEPVPMGSMTWSEAVDEFNKRLEYDDIKTNYAKTNSIKLIRLPYWEFNDDYYMKILSNEILKTENVIVDKIS